jgi:hypothetical protein
MGGGRYIWRGDVDPVGSDAVAPPATSGPSPIPRFIPHIARGSRSFGAMVALAFRRAIE